MAIRAAAVVVAIEAVLDIVTVLVVQTVMAIVIVLAIETDIHLSGIEPDIKYLLEDAPTRSLLCHRVPRYQASPDTLNRNYEVRITSPTPLHHSGGQVEAVVYHRDLDWGLICRWPLLSYSYWGTARNVDTRGVGIVLSLFWGGEGRISSTLSS